MVARLPFLAADPPFSPFPYMNAIATSDPIIQVRTTPLRRPTAATSGATRISGSADTALKCYPSSRACAVHFAARIAHIRDGRRVVVPGILLVRQKPGKRVLHDCRRQFCRQIGVTPWNGQDSTVGGVNREHPW